MNEPPEWTAFLDGSSGAKAPATGEGSTLYEWSPHGPSAKELAEAATRWFRANKHEVLSSRAETMLAGNGWKIVWTPPYCPKFQPIELAWGVGKQRVGCLFFKGRDLKITKEHLRIGSYGGSARGRTFEPCNVWDCSG